MTLKGHDIRMTLCAMHLLVIMFLTDKTDYLITHTQYLGWREATFDMIVSTVCG